MPIQTPQVWPNIWCQMCSVGAPMWDSPVGAHLMPRPRVGGRHEPKHAVVLAEASELHCGLT